MKTLLIIVLIYIAWRILKKIIFFRFVRIRPRQSHASPASAQQTRPASIAEDMVLDAVCGSYVPVRSAIRVERGGKVAYFCGPECRDKT